MTEKKTKTTKIRLERLRVNGAYLAVVLVVAWPLVVLLVLSWLCLRSVTISPGLGGALTGLTTALFLLLRIPLKWLFLQNKNR